MIRLPVKLSLSNSFYHTTLNSFSHSNFSYSYTNSYTNFLDCVGRCRWSTNTGESLLYVKYAQNKLNTLDVEKKTLTLKDSIMLSYAGNFRDVFLYLLLAFFFYCPLHDAELISAVKGSFSLFFL